MAAMGARENGIEKATGVAWSDWTAWLTVQGAREREHATIARLAEQHLGELGITAHQVTGEPLNAGWWAQGIAIEFELDHGLRAAGQTSRGDFAVSASKTLPGTIDDALRAWLTLVGGLVEVAGAGMMGEPAVTRTDKWRYWRVGLADGSRVSVTVSAREAAEGAAPKAVVAVNHGELESADVGERMRAWWKELLRRLG